MLDSSWLEDLRRTEIEDLLLLPSYRNYYNGELLITRGIRSILPENILTMPTHSVDDHTQYPNADDSDAVDEQESSMNNLSCLGRRREGMTRWHTRDLVERVNDVVGSALQVF